MAPEQVLGRPLTAQADVYAFGVLLFELLAGVKPVAGNSVDKIFQQILYQQIDLQPLRDLRVPETACSVVVWCTGKQLDQRAPSLKAVVDEIDWILDPSRPKPVRPPSVPAFTAEAMPASPAASEPEPAQSTQTASKQSTRQTAARTVPVETATRPERSARSASGAGGQMPGFLGSLPAGLRTQAGLMVLAGGAVLVLMALLYVALSMAHLV
jgi:serine/threonine-protein kinase